MQQLLASAASLESSADHIHIALTLHGKGLRGALNPAMNAGRGCAVIVQQDDLTEHNINTTESLVCRVVGCVGWIANWGRGIL